MRFRCKVCRVRVSIYPTYSNGGRRIVFTCPNCLASGSFRNKDYVPFLFVKNISLASRQYFGVLNPSQLRLGGARHGLNPQRTFLRESFSRAPKP